MFSFFNQYEHPVTVTTQLLKHLHVKVTGTTVNETILNHPDYPSILSISDALNAWHVENAVIKVEPEQISELPLPCIAFTNTINVFVLITEIKNDEVFYLDETNKIKTKELSVFSKEFKEVVLLAQANENSGEANFEQAKQKENIKQLKIPAFILVGLLLIAAAAFSSPLHSWRGVGGEVLLLLNFCGLLIAAILLWYEVDKANPALQKICTGGKKTNCNAILNSKAAKILGVSWSELGFFYFSGCFLICLLIAFTGNAVLLLFIQIACLAAVLYVPFSIFYQWKIAKQWCPLCLTVQAILFLEFVLFLPTISSQLLTAFAFQLTNLSTLFFAFSIPVIVWLIIKPLLYYKQKGKEDFRSLQRIKFNTDIFNALLKKQKYLTVSPEGLGIMLGNKNAANTLIKVCNPYCQPCAKVHPEIEKLLEANKNLKVQIIFRATNDENDITALPAKHLLAIAENNNEVKTKHALDDWYLAEKKDYNLFAEKYKLNGEIKMQDKKIDMMKNWYDKAEIKFTPTIFFNGYQLPDAYSIGDLKYFLAE